MNRFSRRLSHGLIDVVKGSPDTINRMGEFQMTFTKIRKNAKTALAGAMAAVMLAAPMQPWGQQVAQARQSRNNHAIQGQQRHPNGQSSQNNWGNRRGQGSQISEREIVLFENYIAFNEGQYGVTKEGLAALNPAQLRKLAFVLQETNSRIKETIEYVNQSKELNFYSFEENEVVFSEFYFDPIMRSNGINRVSFTWWGGIRVQLSRNTIRNMAYGISIAGVFISKGKVMKPLRAMGITANHLVTRGIWFEMLTVIPINWGWQ